MLNQSNIIKNLDINPETIHKTTFNIDNILDIQTLIKRNKQFNEAQLRWIISQRKINGIDKTGAIFKIGKRWFFDMPLLIQWAKNKKVA